MMIQILLLRRLHFRNSFQRYRVYELKYAIEINSEATNMYR